VLHLPYQVRCVLSQSIRNHSRALDPFGVLGPNEIQVKSSNRNLKTNDGLLTDTLLGDVLVSQKKMYTITSG